MKRLVSVCALWALVAACLAAQVAISTISPTTGPTSGGTLVAITGSGFSGATAVNFSSSAAPQMTVVSDTQITALSPGGLTGVANVSVVAPSGSSAAIVPFTYYVFALSASQVAAVNVAADALYAYLGANAPQYVQGISQPQFEAIAQQVVTIVAEADAGPLTQLQYAEQQDAANIASLQSGASALGATVTGIQTWQKTVALLTTTNAISAKQVADETTLASLGSGVASAESSITGLSASVGQINATLATHGNSLAALSANEAQDASSLGSLQGTLTALNAHVDAQLGPHVSSVVATPQAGGLVLVTWTTDEPATSSVVYGPKTPLGGGCYGALSNGTQASPTDATLVTSHAVTVGPLALATLYYLRPDSANAAGTVSCIRVASVSAVQATTLAQ